MIIHMTEKEYDREFKKYDTNFAAGLAMLFSSAFMIVLFAIILAFCGFSFPEIKSITSVGGLGIVFGIFVCMIAGKNQDYLARDVIDGNIVIDK